MIPLQFSCHNNDHTAQLSLGGHAAPSLTHTHRHTVFCECSHSVLCAIDSRHTHTHIWLSSDVSAAACQIRADGSGHEARSLLSWSCCPYTAQYTHRMTLSTSTYRTIIVTHVVVPSKLQPQTWGGCSSPVAVDLCFYDTCLSERGWLHRFRSGRSHLRAADPFCEKVQTLQKYADVSFGSAAARIQTAAMSVTAPTERQGTRSSGVGVSFSAKPTARLCLHVLTFISFAFTPSLLS